MHETVTVYTIGHSTRPIDEFVRTPNSFSIQTLVDIRTIPRSRHNPQYEQHALEASLKSAAIAYIHMPALGGLRSTTKASPNTGWRNRSFRGYADYMQTAAFQTAMQTLSQLADRNQVHIDVCRSRAMAMSSLTRGGCVDRSRHPG